ncbi:MAG: hypothetical protein PHC91_06880 [Eubacteriales bacterium]|nr:hypothetical protein [Eubacteriales bacterium]
MLEHFNSCDEELILRQLIKVQAQVEVTPLVRHGSPKIYCLNSSVKPNSYYNDCENDEYECESEWECDAWDCGHCTWNHDCGSACGSDNHCNFTLTQMICIEIPISFDADVDIKKGILCCDTPYSKPDLRTECKKDIINCRQIYILMKRQF